MSIACHGGGEDTPTVNKIDEFYRVKALVYLNGAIAALTQNYTFAKDIEFAQDNVLSAKDVLANWWDIKQRTNDNSQQVIQPDNGNTIAG